MSQDLSARRGTRERLSVLLLLVTFVLTFVGGPLMYVATVVGDEDAFVAVADRVVASPDVEEAIAGTIAAVTFEAVAADGRLAEALPGGLKTFTVPLTRIAVEEFTKVSVTALQSEGATEIRGAALREVHQQVTSGDDEVVIDLRAVLVRTAREIGGIEVGTGVAKAVSGTDAGRFVLAESGSTESKLFKALGAVPTLGWLVSVFSLMTLIAGVLVATDRSRALVRGGLLTAAAAAAASIAVALGLDVLVGGDAGEASIGTAVADVVSADFSEQQVWAVLIGLVLALIGLVLGDRPSAVVLRSLPADLWHRRPGVAQKLQGVTAENPPLTRTALWLAGVVALSLWSAPTMRVVLTIVVLTTVCQIGAWFLTGTTPNVRSWRGGFGLDTALNVDRDGLRQTGGVRANVTILGIILFLFWPGWSSAVISWVFILVGLLHVAVDLPGLLAFARSNRRSEAGIEGANAPAQRQPRVRYFVAFGVAAIAVTLGVGATAGSHERIEQSRECNGHVELCNRRVDETVFAGSHNSMASTDLGWELAMQTGDIVDQLDSGVRALLIDALYWDTPAEGLELDGTDNAAIEAALGDDDPQPGAWMCHAFCALGATELTGGLTEIALWLQAHPREVVLIIVQDEISENDLTNAFVESGLRDLAYTHSPGSEYPTLGQLIEDDTRLLVYGENMGEPGSWLQNAWESSFRETPFTFAVQSDFSCDSSRGDDSNELFLINHWITTGIPVREAAISVNSESALLDRVQECLEQRGSLPTILAVDFVGAGDLIAVVDQLNKVGQ